MYDEYWYGYYQTLRLEARSKTVDAYNRRIKSDRDRKVWKGITLASIDMEAIEFARLNWPKHFPADYDPFPYSWERLYFRFMQKAANFNVAVWQTLGKEKILNGLALGKPSSGKTHLTINWVERSYAPSYSMGGVLMPILSCAEEYAKLLGCERVLIKDPVDPDSFKAYGFGPSDAAPKGAVYLSKELDHGK